MTDIVERLRFADDALCDEAADEIERLRGGCLFSNPCKRYRGLLTDIDILQKEIERLRKLVGDVGSL